MPDSEESPAFVALVQATAGAAGGVIASFSLQPLEVVKTRVQLSGSGSASTSGAFNDVISEDGVLGLYRGVVAKCTETGLKNFIYFYIYDTLNQIAKQRMKPTTGVKLALGYLAGAANTTITMPLETLSTMVQVESKGAMELLNQAVANEGLGRLYKGYWFNLALCVNPAIQNTCFDKVKDAILRYKARQLTASGQSYTYQSYPSMTPLQSFALGAFAKAVATTITFPLVRVKTIIQAGKDSSATKEERQETSFLQTLGQFYQGIGSSLTKSVLQAALLYMSKDQIENFVVIMFQLSAKMMRRRSGRVKLGVTSGRPLAS